MERMIVSQHSAPVAKTKSGTKTNMTTILLHEAPTDEQNDNETIWAAELILTTIKMESVVVIVTSRCGLRTIARVPTDKQTQMILSDKE